MRVATPALSRQPFCFLCHTFFVVSINLFSCVTPFCFLRQPFFSPAFLFLSILKYTGPSLRTDCRRGPILRTVAHGFSSFTGLRGRFSVFAAQKHQYLRRSQKPDFFTTPLSPVKVRGWRKFVYRLPADA